VAENVGGIISIHDGEYFEEICSQLEGEGYAVQSFIIPALAVNAPHKRNRVWIIAYAKNSFSSGNGRGDNGDTTGSERTLQVEGPNKPLWQNDIAHTNKYDKRNNGREIQGKAETNEGTLERENGQRMWSRISSTDINVTNATSTGLEERKEEELGKSIHDAERTNTPITNATSARCEGGVCEPGERESGIAWERSWYEVAAEFCRMDDGVSDELYKLRTSNRMDRLKGLGNAILPQIAEIIFKAIKEIEKS